MMIRIAVCVDDTDDFTKVTSTGKVADRLARLAREMGGTVELGVTRHQLPILESIAYTSHNSSMCFTASMPDDFSAENFHAHAARIVAEESVEAADPGLCIYRLPDPLDEEGLKRLIAYGIHAKTELVTKDEAYATAAAIDGLSLTEHGGGGDGVIGALAGVALRLSGSDGHFRGKTQFFDEPKELPLSVLLGLFDDTKTVQVCDSTTLDPLEGEPLITIPVLLKPILLDAKKTLLAEPSGEGSYTIIDVQGVKDRFDARPRWKAVCDGYAEDNDSEEFMDMTNARTCANCLYRRWVVGGFRCVLERTPVPIADEQ